MNPTISRATYEDMQEILKLQYLAFKSIAALYNKPIQPLTQTLDELIEEYNNGIILKMTDNDKMIIGSIRAKENDGSVYIGKLIVHPDYQGNGYGTMLLKEIEKYYANKRYELFTSSNSSKNIQLYQKSGYRIFARKKINDELEFVYMEKQSNSYEMTAGEIHAELKAGYDDMLAGRVQDATAAFDAFRMTHRH